MNYIYKHFLTHSESVCRSQPSQIKFFWLSLGPIFGKRRMSRGIEWSRRVFSDKKILSKASWARSYLETTETVARVHKRLDKIFRVHKRLYNKFSVHKRLDNILWDHKGLNTMLSVHFAYYLVWIQVTAV